MRAGGEGVTAEAWRVAQLVVERGPGDEGLRGSGYLVGPGRVLTAAHVVAGASAVRVRLDVGQLTEVEVRAEGWWADPAGSNGTDLAVVMIPGGATAERAVEPARFGRISDGTAVLRVQAFLGLLEGEQRLVDGVVDKRAADSGRDEVTGAAGDDLPNAPAAVLAAVVGIDPHGELLPVAGDRQRGLRGLAGPARPTSPAPAAIVAAASTAIDVMRICIDVPQWIGPDTAPPHRAQHAARESPGCIQPPAEASPVEHGRRACGDGVEIHRCPGPVSR